MSNEIGAGIFIALAIVCIVVGIIKIKKFGVAMFVMAGILIINALQMLLHIDWLFYGSMAVFIIGYGVVTAVSGRKNS